MDGVSISFSVIMAIVLGYSAHKYGKSPILWGVLGFFFGFIALGIFLIKIDKKVIGWIILIVSIIAYLILIIGIIALVFVGFSL